MILSIIKTLLINIVNPKLAKFEHALYLALIILSINIIISIPLLYWIINNCVTLRASLEPEDAYDRGYSCDLKEYEAVSEVTYDIFYLQCLDDDDFIGVRTIDATFSIKSIEHLYSTYKSAFNDPSFQISVLYKSIDDDQFSTECDGNGWSCYEEPFVGLGSSNITQPIRFNATFISSNIKLDMEIESVYELKKNCYLKYNYDTDSIKENFDSIYSNIILSCSKSLCPNYITILSDYFAVIGFFDITVTILVIIIYICYKSNGFKKFNRKKSEFEIRKFVDVIGEF